MKDQLLRFDSLIAVIALLMSSVTAGAMLYQTHVIEQQFAATVWPYLSVEVDNNPNSISVHLINDGAGPALVRSAQLVVDGKPMSTWNELFALIHADPDLRAAGRRASGSSEQSSSIDASTIVRAGDSRPLVAESSAAPIVLKAVRKHRIALNFCYCSINDRCWTLDSDLGGSRVTIPQPVLACRLGASIGAIVQ